MEGLRQCPPLPTHPPRLSQQTAGGALCPVKSAFGSLLPHSESMDCSWDYLFPFLPKPLLMLSTPDITTRT